MNSAEFENWMKQQVDSEEYMPTAGMWEKLESDLQDKQPKKRIFLLMPVVKIAAAVLVLFSAGYFIWSEKEGSALHENNRIAGSAMIHSNGAELKETTPEGKLQTASANAAANRVDKFLPEKNNRYQSDNITEPAPLTAEPRVAVITKADTARTLPRPGSPGFNYPEPTYYTPDRNVTSGNDIGIAAQIGKPGLGSIGYQIGFVGRKQLSDRIFMEATVALASTTVNADRNYSFTSVNIGADGLSNNFEKETENINARYARNIIALGANQSLGLQVTRNVAISGGVAVYRNINPSLTLTNRADIGNEALTGAVVSSEQKLSLWDVGFTANADYRLTEKLLFNLHYRKGVTNYYQTDNKQYKNSIFNVGIKYMFSGSK